MLSLLLASFVTFFVAIDPVAMAPMFTTMTAGMTPEWRRMMAFKSIAIATGILLAFAFGGAWLLEQINVSIDAFRIAGGILLFLIAVDMLFEKRAERREERAEEVAAKPSASHAGQMVLPMGPGGHYAGTFKMNGKPVDAMVDTGASTVASCRSRSAAPGHRCGPPMAGACTMSVGMPSCRRGWPPGRCRGCCRATPCSPGSRTPSRRTVTRTSA